MSNASGYRLDVSLHNSFNGYVNGYHDLNVGNVTNRNVTGLAPSTSYYYRVRAYNASGSSANSNVIHINTLANPTPTPIPTPTPGPPVNVKVASSLKKLIPGQTAVMTFTLSPRPVIHSTNVNYSVTGDATRGVDFVVSGTPGRVTIRAGQSSASVIVTSTNASGRNKNATFAETSCGPNCIVPNGDGKSVKLTLKK